MGSDRLCTPPQRRQSHPDRARGLDSQARSSSRARSRVHARPIARLSTGTGAPHRCIRRMVAAARPVVKRNRCRTRAGSRIRSGPGMRPRSRRHAGFVGSQCRVLAMRGDPARRRVRRPSRHVGAHPDRGRCHETRVSFVVRTDRGADGSELTSIFSLHILSEALPPHSFPFRFTREPLELFDLLTGCIEERGFEADFGRARDRRTPRPADGRSARRVERPFAGRPASASGRPKTRFTLQRLHASPD